MSLFNAEAMQFTVFHGDTAIHNIPKIVDNLLKNFYFQLQKSLHLQLVKKTTI